MASYAHGRVVIGGSMSTADSWSTGFAFSGADIVSPVALQAALVAFKDDVVDWWSSGTPSLQNVTSADSFIDSIRAYYYEAGSTSADTVAEYVYPSPINGAQSGKLSARTACVATLLTGHPGRSFKGRMYLPATGAVLANHQHSSGNVTDIATATAALLSNWNALTETGISVACVAGKTSLTVVSEVRVDSIPDTIRARSRKMVALSQHTVSV